MRDEKHSVSIWFVRQALMGLRGRGLDAETLLERAAIPSALLHSDQSRVSAESFGTLWLAIAAQLDDELFGLDSRRMKVGSFALLCRNAVRTATLQEALGLSLQFFNVVLDDCQLELDRVDGTAQVRLIDRAGCARPEPFRVFAHETLLMLLQGLMCWLVSRRIPIRQAAFAYPRPPWWPEYRAMYASELQFDGAQTAIGFSADVLDAAVVQTEATAREFLRHAPHNFIVKYKDPNSFQSRIRRYLRERPADLWPGFAGLAAEFDIASSTLHRKLEQEGVTFRQIRDGLRRDLAIDRLTHSGLSINTLAAELGFAEPSAFHRAFKQWTGLRPGDYRRGAIEPAAHAGDGR